MNEEFPVSASHKLALITSLPFVHTARRYYRLNDLVRFSDWPLSLSQDGFDGWKDNQTGSFRGSKSRNKVSVGEPAEGSLTLSLSGASLSGVSTLALGLCTLTRRLKSTLL
jgi:hypothetical protein